MAGSSSTSLFSGSGFPPAAKRARHDSAQESRSISSLRSLFDRQEHHQVIEQASALLQSGLNSTEQAVTLAYRAMSYAGLGIHDVAVQDALASHTFAEWDAQACLVVAKALTTVGLNTQAYIFVVKMRTRLFQSNAMEALESRRFYRALPPTRSARTLTPPLSSSSSSMRSTPPADEPPLLRDISEVEARLRPSGFSTMPVELVQCVLLWIGDVQQTAQCMRVSRQWRIAIQTCPKLWKRVELWKPHRLPTRGYVIDEPECQLPPPRTTLASATFALRHAMLYTRGSVHSVSLDLRGCYNGAYAEACWSMLESVAPQLHTLSLCISWQDRHAKTTLDKVIRAGARITSLTIYYDAKPRKDPDDEFEPLHFSLLTDDPEPAPIKKVSLFIPECDVAFTTEVAQRFAHVEDFALVREASEDVSITWILAFFRAARLSLRKYQLSCPVSDAVWCPPGASSAVKRGDPFIANIVLENLQELRTDVSEWGTCIQAINTRFVMPNVHTAEVVTTVPHLLVGFCLFRVKSWSLTEVYDAKVAEIALNYLLNLAPELEVLEMRTPVGGCSVLPGMLLENLITLSNSIPTNARGYTVSLSRLRTLKFVNSAISGKQLIDLVKARLRFAPASPQLGIGEACHIDASLRRGDANSFSTLLDAQKRIHAEPCLPPFRPITAIVLTDCPNVSEAEQAELAALVPVFHCSTSIAMGPVHGGFTAPIWNSPAELRRLPTHRPIVAPQQPMSWTH
ncbi:hypothetical protein OC834_000206 [Tilletia horrida]|nr:hypothetical protein OC834_000206 [Tilletia horrida]